MSLVHKLPENLNKNLTYQRISAGQAITFAWEKTTTPTRNLVHAYADSLGCPAEYILFPLLTVTASFIGTHGRIQINDSWEEPSIVWFNVCARKGQKKTAALNVLARPVREIEQDLQEDFKHDNPEAQDRALPCLLVDHFSFEKLHQVMSQNNNKVLGDHTHNKINVIPTFQLCCNLCLKLDFLVYIFNIIGYWCNQDYQNINT